MSEAEGEAKLSLLDHLTELRGRLVKVVIAILVLGGLALSFAKPIFRVLVAPILEALPAGQRTLIQTSAVEELNTLIKVGLYTGVFLSAPVILGQIWAFVAPGLYANERRMAAPFVLAGTACFVSGVVFCYFVVLPPAFQFLLQPEDLRATAVQLRTASGDLEDAGRLLRAGDLDRAEKMLASVETTVAALPSTDPPRAEGVLARAEKMDVLIDAADRAVARSGRGGAELAQAIEARARARTAALAGDGRLGEDQLVEAEAHLRAALAGGLGGEEGVRAAKLLERQEAASRALVSADARQSYEDWTKPMLSMKEQLHLVLVLLLAFGVIFEIPVLFALLAALGVINGDELARHRRYAVVINVIVAAILTPTGDPFNLALMAGPMILCYEVGVLAARVIARRRRAREAAALAA